MINTNKGLTDNEVNERIEKGLVNNRGKAGKVTNFQIIIENTFTIFNMINFVILIFMFTYYFNNPDNNSILLDSVGVIVITLTNTIIGIYQKIKGVRILENLELLKEHKINVLRNGGLELIDTHSIVLDDIVLIKKGDQVPVDGKIINSERLEIDESLLTGESLPTPKVEGEQLLSGSFCVYGSAYIIAEKVGNDNYAMKITQLAKKYKLLNSPLMQKINLIFVISFILTIIFVAVESLLNFNQGGFTATEVRKISTIAFSLIPEGLVFFATVTFTVGVYRISKLGAIVQKINAIDAFPSIKVICMDKTGTLTKNQISVADITELENETAYPLEMLLGTYFKSSSDVNATIKALEIYPSLPAYKVLDELPFRSEQKMSAVTIEFDNGSVYTFIFGAFDILLKNISNTERINSLYHNKELNGYRNLIFGIIKSSIAESLSPNILSNKKIIPLCIVSLKDTARNDAHLALRLFKDNSIQTKILSGDSLDSILSTLKEIGWQMEPNSAISGLELDLLSDEEFNSAILRKSIFSRLSPGHKLKIIKSLKHQHIPVTVIGDGVNDLPAMKEANLGIAMEEGSTITKEISDIVIQNNKFEILPEIFNEGNKIINTVIYVARMMLAKNITLMALTFLSWFTLTSFPFTPRKVAFISLLATGLPSYFIALLNKQSKPVKGFFKDLLLFVFISSAVLTAMAVSANLYGSIILKLNNDDLINLINCVLIVGSTFNFLCAVMFDDKINRIKYFLLSLIILLIYFFLSALNIDFLPVNIIKIFYEITFINIPLLLAAAKIFVPGVVILLIAHFVRSAIINK